MASHHGFNLHELDLREDEYLVSVMRKHWFVLFVHVIPFKFLFLLPLVVMALLPTVGVGDAQAATIVFFSTLWMLVILMVIFTIWTNYYLDIWIVTNQRIIDIEQKTLFNREIKTLRMDTVQDVQVDIAGLFETFLRFGTLRVQTAGTGGTDAKIVGIPRPSFERDIIMEQVHTLTSEAASNPNSQHSGMKAKHPHLT